MKIIGILLLLLGLFLTAVGFGAGLFFFMNTGPEFACSLADSDKERVEKAEKQLQVAKGKPEESALTSAYETAKRAAYVSQTHCDEMKTQQRVFVIAGCVAGLFGLLLALAGIGMLVFGIKKSRSG